MGTLRFWPSEVNGDRLCSRHSLGAGNRTTGKSKVNGKIVPIPINRNEEIQRGSLPAISWAKRPSRLVESGRTTGEAIRKFALGSRKERRTNIVLRQGLRVDRELRRNFIAWDGEQYDAFLKGFAERRSAPASVEDFAATVGYGGWSSAV